MSSEIRVNSLSSRAGLSTVTFTDTGPIFSGITTFQDNSGFNVGTGGSIFSPASNTIALGTNNAERLRITSTGRQQSHAGYAGVGINTFASWARTGGAIRAEVGYNAVTTDYMYFGTGTNHPLSLRVNNDNALYLKNDAGRSVGIGTDNPGAKTHIDSVTSNTPLVVEASQNNRSRIVFRNNVETGTECNIELFDDDLRFVTNSGERLRIDSSGRLLIGETSAVLDTSNALLQMGAEQGSNVVLYRDDSSVSADDSLGLIRFYSNAGGNKIEHARISGIADATSGGVNGAPGRLVFYTEDVGSDSDPVERLRITSSGELLISNSGNRFLSLDRTNANNGSGEFNVNVEVNSQTSISYDDGAPLVIGTSSSPRTQAGFSEKLRITSGGDVLIGGQSAYTYDDTGASNTILDIANSTNNKRGILSLSGNSNANGPSIGTIWFNNDQNSGTGPGATMKLVAAIQAKAVTSDSNAGDDSGAYLQFLTKPESAALAESMVIHSDGEVTKVKQPGFFTRRAVGGDGRSGGAQEWSVSGTGSFNTGSHFNASNGRFTAPIAGRYLFTASPGYKQSGQNFNFYFRINGSDASEGCRFVDGGDDLVSHSTGTATVIYNLSANDYVDVYIGSTHHVNLTFNFFMGYLLG